MKVNHYATIFTNTNILPAERTTRVKSNDINDLSLPKDCYRVITFDRMIDEIEYNGNIYPVATKKLNQKIYHIGKFENLEKLSEKDKLFVKLAQNNDCIGMVSSNTGLESMVFEGEGIIEINGSDKIVIKECSLKMDEIFPNVENKSKPKSDAKLNSENADLTNSNTTRPSSNGDEENKEN